MSQTEKSALFKELKAAGVTFTKHYREYTTGELKSAVNKLREGSGRMSWEAEQNALRMAAAPDVEQPAEPANILPFEKPVARGGVPDTEAGIRQNTANPDEPRRIDEQGLAWFQDEVRKPPFPQPRARRVLRYQDPGTETRTVVNGSYLESFEVAGTEHRQGEIKITLPSYQVGIYKDPRLPFKIHIYNDVRGFDLFEVYDFYGGADLVPEECKTMYVENVLCFDIRTVVRAIETEARQLELRNQRGA